MNERTSALVEKIVTWVTPLMGVALLGLLMTGYGFVHPQQENNVLQFFFGIPILLIGLGGHWLVRKALSNNVLYVWIAEVVIVGFMWYVFQRS